MTASTTINNASQAASSAASNMADRAHQTVDRVADKATPALDRVAHQRHNTVDKVADRPPAAWTGPRRTRRCSRKSASSSAKSRARYVRERPLVAVAGALALVTWSGRILMT